MVISFWKSINKLYSSNINSEISLKENKYGIYDLSSEEYKIQLIETINEYMDTEQTIKVLSNIEICLYLSFLAACILFYLFLYVKIFIFSIALFPIFYLAIESPVRLKMKKLEFRGKQLIEIGKEEDTDKVFIQSLDKYLLIAIQGEIEDEEYKNKDKFNWTKQCIQEWEIIKEDLERHKEIIKTLQKYHWCEIWKSRKDNKVNFLMEFS